MECKSWEALEGNIKGLLLGAEGYTAKAFLDALDVPELLVDKVPYLLHVVGLQLDKNVPVTRYDVDLMHMVVGRYLVGDSVDVQRVVLGVLEPHSD